MVARGKSKIALLLYLSLAVVISAHSFLPSVQAQQVDLPWLHVEGNRIVTQTGSPVILRGVVIEDPYFIKYIDSEGPIVGRWSLIDEDFRQISQNWHANVVTVVVQPDLYTYDENYSKDLLDPIVDEARNYGLYLILMWHAQGNPITGQSPPDSMTGISPFHGIPCNPNMTFAVRFLQDVSRRYKDDSWVLYSIFNEPNYISWSDWRPVAEQLIDVVRSNNPRALILVPGVRVAYDLTGVPNDPVRRDNIVYEVHPYPGFPSWAGSWDDNFGFLSNNYPIIAGEWGFSPGSSDAGLDATIDSYGRPLLDYFNKKGISWIAWIWSCTWTPNILQAWNYQPTQFGQFVKATLSSIANQSLTVRRLITGNIVSVSHGPDLGQTFTITVTIRNTGSSAWPSAGITISVYGPNKTLVAKPILILGNINPGVDYVYNIGWTVPLGAPEGIYQYDVCLNYANGLIDRSAGPSNTITVS